MQISARKGAGSESISSEKTVVAIYRSTTFHQFSGFNSQKREQKPRRCLYEILDANRKGTNEEIRVAYYKKARQCHPDRAGEQSVQEFQQIQQAYAILSDPDLRAIYDKFGYRGLEMASKMSPDDVNDLAKAVARVPGLGFRIILSCVGVLTCCFCCFCCCLCCAPCRGSHQRPCQPTTFEYSETFYSATSKTRKSSEVSSPELHDFNAPGYT
ncbi:unnamed protein product [Caenorhabditis auriculariae]|uniref:J domain-containing protein n=1 Tax=Caenorhabditis auriculariae TaxID=2777116 RepID=A0A8S1H4L2_9PELO|nr:unnamed protein product [Caenorhabditis auriculariae]